MRKLLEKFARKNGLDPLRADTWYHTPEKALRQFKVPLLLLSSFFVLLLSPSLLLFVFNRCVRVLAQSYESSKDTLRH